MSVYFPYLYKEASAPVKIVTWADGTDEEIAAMIAAADAGKIDLSDYWSIGDERTVHLGAMTVGDAFTTAMAAQDVVLVLMDTGAQSGYVDVNDNPVNFVVGQKNCLSEKGRMNTTASNSGGWPNCAMRTDLDDKYYNALPVTFKSCLKQFKVYLSGAANGYIALFSEKNIFGTTTYSLNTEGQQIEYYKTTANRIKQVNGSNSFWWEQDGNMIPAISSYYKHWCGVNTSGNALYGQANIAGGIAPFMCI